MISFDPFSTIGFDLVLSGFRNQMQTAPATVERTYLQLKEMAVNYDFKPDSRLNETELAKKLATSRTPLREALNRLVAEGFFTFRSGKGFFCRSLNPIGIMHLYEARAAIECEAASLAAHRADPTKLKELEQYLDESKANYTPGTSPTELLRMDEAFHVGLTSLTDNKEMIRLLENVNDRIRFIRLIDLRTLAERNGGEVVTIRPHAEILQAVKQGDSEAARQAMVQHLTKRLEAVTENVRNAFAELYTPGD
ncbi:GntR family transcriptional regulator [uncultured Sulfitobacter sp.]|uniref:GntR family transcriptional regulator n=1 Tax=uncultured Sulfitobacter sp. TaxID=191468 RepID=UPI0032B26622